MRFRLLLVIVGALLVAATWTFPVWYPLLPRGGAGTQELFPGLDIAQQPLFAALPADQQTAYLSALEIEPTPGLTLAMLSGRLTGGSAAPPAEQTMPELIGSAIVARAILGGVDALRSAEGNVIIYQGADGAYLVRLEDFSVTPGPGLRVVLSAAALPATGEEMRTGDIDLDLGALKGVTGSQNYQVPAEIDLRQYRSLVIYSESLDLIYASGRLFLSSF